MPKTPVHKQGKPTRGKYNIGLAGQPTIMKPVTQSC